jgi:hypothetical protein
VKIYENKDVKIHENKGLKIYENKDIFCNAKTYFIFF